jgi:hypothetical protein
MHDEIVARPEKGEVRGLARYFLALSPDDVGIDECH